MMNLGKAEVHFRVISYFAKLAVILAAIAGVMYAVVNLFSFGVALFVFLILPLAAGAYYLIYSTYELEMETDKIWEESFTYRKESKDEPTPMTNAPDQHV